MHLAATWPTGISLLLDAGAQSLLNKLDSAGYSPLAHAVYWNCPAAVKLLVEAGCSLFTHVDSHGNMFDNVIVKSLEYGSVDLVRYLVEELAERRRRLAALACQMLPTQVLITLRLSPDLTLDVDARYIENLLEENGVPVPGSLKVPGWWKTIYAYLFNSRWLFTRHYHDHSVTELATIIYNAGFQDIHDNKDFARSFFAHASLSDGLLLLYLDILEGILFFSWLLDKGLRLEDRILYQDQDGSSFHVPAAFCLGFAIAESWGNSYIF